MSIGLNRAVTLLDDGLEFESEGMTLRYAWSGLEAVEADQDNLYVMPDGLMHYVIPKSAFGPDQLREFMETLHRNMA